MKNILKLEELLLFLFSIFLFSQLGYVWWIYALLLFAPDLSMMGYIWNPRAGAWIYNLIHHKAVAIVLYLAGLFLGSAVMQLIGVILLGHSSLDRVFGYGLKYPDSFQNTHLGIIGKSN